MPKPLTVLPLESWQDPASVFASVGASSPHSLLAGRRARCRGGLELGGHGRAGGRAGTRAVRSADGRRSRLRVGCGSLPRRMDRLDRLRGCGCPRGCAREHRRSGRARRTVAARAALRRVRPRTASCVGGRARRRGGCVRRTRLPRPGTPCRPPTRTGPGAWSARAGGVCRADRTLPGRDPGGRCVPAVPHDALHRSRHPSIRSPPMPGCARDRPPITAGSSGRGMSRSPARVRSGSSR